MDVGSVVAGRYTIERRVGGGGMGIVWAARDEALGRRVALKVLRTDRAGDDRAGERLRREARALAQVQNERIVRVLDLGTWNDHVFIVMEYVSGRTLDLELSECGPLSPTRAVDLVLEVATALAEAHREGIIHRDLKPSNLILAEQADGAEILKILDFGIAKTSAAALSALTETEALLGSPKYIAPEQIRDSAAVDVRSDIWSLGVVLYELLTGKVPWAAFTVSGMLAQIAADPPRSPVEHRGDLDPALVAVVLRCLEKDPAARPATVAVLARELAPFATRGIEVADLVDRTLRRVKPARDSRLEPPEAPHSTLGATSLTAAGPLSPGIERRGVSGRPRSMPVVVAAIALVAAAAFIGYRSLRRANVIEPSHTAVAPPPVPSTSDSPPTAAAPAPAPHDDAPKAPEPRAPAPLSPSRSRLAADVGAPPSRRAQDDPPLSKARPPGPARAASPAEDDFGPRK